MIVRGNHSRGNAVFECPKEAWDFKMEKQLDGASTKIYEKTTDVLGVRVLCEPRIIRVSWEFK